MSDMLRRLVEEEMDGKMKELHTAFLGKVTCVKGCRADVQPLALTRLENGEVAALPLVADVPRLQGVEAKEGDVCLCVVCERELGAALQGELALPRPGHHRLADCVMVGVVEA